LHPSKNIGRGFGARKAPIEKEIIKNAIADVLVFLSSFEKEG
jgi:hypothetical protein